MQTLQFESMYAEEYSADWVGHQIWSKSRAAHAAKGRDRWANYEDKNRWIEFGIETLDPTEVWLNYQMIDGRVSLLITIFGKSRKWVAHTFLEELSTDIRNQVIEQLGDPNEFHTSQCA